MIEPTMKAIPPRKNSRSHTSTAASTFSTKPVSEIALGVRRDSIRRLRTSSRRSPEPIGARAARGRLAPRAVAAAARAPGRGVLSGSHRRAVVAYPLARTCGGRDGREAPHARPGAREPARAVGGRAGGQRSEQRVDDEVVGGDDDHERHQERVEQPQHAHDPVLRQPRQRPADHQREGDVHRGHGRVRVEQRAHRGAGVRDVHAGEVRDAVDEAPLGHEARRRRREHDVADRARSPSRS